LSDGPQADTGHDPAAVRAHQHGGAYAPYVSTAASAASLLFNRGIGYFAGGASVEGYATDATSGKLLWEAVDRRGGTSALVKNTLDTRLDVNIAMDDWAETLARRVQELACGRREGGHPSNKAEPDADGDSPPHRSANGGLRLDADIGLAAASAGQARADRLPPHLARGLPARRAPGIGGCARPDRPGRLLGWRQAVGLIRLRRAHGHARPRHRDAARSEVSASQVDAISGVSGGSFPAAYYGLYRDKTFGRFETDFLYDDTNSYIYGTYLLPWNWAWLVEPGVGTNDYMDRVYDRTMFHGATYRDLEARGRPLIAIGATDIPYGTPLLLTQETFDLICSDLYALPISRAVAASNGFPGLFSPVTLTNHAAACGGRKPGWVRRVSPEERNDALSRIGVEAFRAERYLDPNRTRYLHLADGGISDNLAMRSAGTMMQALSASALRERGYLHTRRLLLISIDGQGTQDSSVAQRKEVGGILSILGLVSGAQIDSYNFETLNAVSQQLVLVTNALRTARCAEGSVIDGAACDDVRSSLVHISLARLPDTPEKANLLAIPTGLTLQRNDVDLLIRAGYNAVTRSPELGSFLGEYPVAAQGAGQRVAARAFGSARSAGAIK
jgi:NTE family protein